MKSENIVLIGMAGVGKSTVGRVLSKELGFAFTDLDEYILEKEGRTAQEIINTEGESTFLEAEARRMHEIDLRRRVVAPGGSIIYISGLMEYLKQNSTLVYLCNSFDDIETRLSDRASRGIVGLRNKSLREVYDERGSLYSKYADFTVNCKGKTADQIAREILNYFAQKN